MIVEHLRPLLENDRDTPSCAISPASWLVGRCQIASNLLFGWAGSRHCRSLMEVCASVTSCGEQWRGPWLNKCPRRSRMQLHRSSTRCRPNQGASVFRTSCIMSVDGVGAFDLVSRNAILRGLMSLPSGERLRPFVRMWPTFRFHVGRDGEVHHIQQGEGGEQGDPVLLCPAHRFGGSKRKTRTWRTSLCLP